MTRQIACDILQISNSATETEIRSALLDMVKVWHPDRFLHDPALQALAQDKMRLIRGAYESLISPEGEDRKVTTTHADAARALDTNTAELRRLRALAEQGDVGAQFTLGVMYDKGEGVPKDAVQAVAWYCKAAEQGHANAQFMLGQKYYFGRGVKLDYAEAVAWFRKAAEQGHANAQFALGQKYYFGRGVKLDYAEAVAWFRKAAEQGQADAQVNLGFMYANGDGVPKDAAQAVAWYRKAAEQGQADAQFNLGNMYGRGEGVPKDAVQAVAWYRKAAEQGQADAQFNLGLMMCANGDGVPKDAAQAVARYRKAVAEGDTDSQAQRTKIEDNDWGAASQRTDRNFSWLILLWGLLSLVIGLGQCGGGAGGPYDEWRNEIPSDPYSR